MENKVSILITTRNRLSEIQTTLERLELLDEFIALELIVCDDGSVDGTYEYIRAEFPKIKLLRNDSSLGLIASRNKLLEVVKTPYAISLDDDAHLVYLDSLQMITDYFEVNPICAVQAFRIFWGEKLPQDLSTDEHSGRVKGYVGCGHAWNMLAWREIPDYPEWYIFYGEEEFASYHLFKNDWEVHYHPDILVHHRVVVKNRKKDSDYSIRQRRSLRAGWYNYFTFYPWKMIPKRLLYTLMIQIKTKALVGDLLATKAIFQAIGDVLINFPRLIKQRDPLTAKQISDFFKLRQTQIYWNKGNHHD